MTVLEYEPKEQPEIYIPTAEEMSTWMADVDNHLDETYSLLRPGQTETEYLQLHDAVRKRVEAEDGSVYREPVVILESGEGKEEMPLANFLQMHQAAKEKFEKVIPQAAHSGELAVEQTVEIDSANPTGEELDKVAHIKQIYESGTYDHLFDPMFDELLDSLNDRERAELTKYQVEKAATRNPKLFEVINKAAKDEMGNYNFDEQYSERLVRSLREYGVETEPLSEEQIEQGIQKAKEIVGANEATAFLQSDTSFMPEERKKQIIWDAKSYRLRFKSMAMIDPTLIKGADGFDSWAGRGYNGTGQVSVREMNSNLATRRSISQISDYATRETQLPKMETYALGLILTDEGPMFYGTNAHRIAAARLRGEKLRFDSMTIYDARNK